MQAARRRPALIRPACPVRFRGLQLRRGQCSVEVHTLDRSGATPDAATLDPVVQRQRPLAYTQVTMVRVHPGSLPRLETGGCRKKAGDWRLQAAGRRLKTGGRRLQRRTRESSSYSLQSPVSSLHMGCWSNGKTLASQAGNRGSTPRRSTICPLRDKGQKQVRGVTAA